MLPIEISAFAFPNTIHICYKTKMVELY